MMSGTLHIRRGNECGVSLQRWQKPSYGQLSCGGRGVCTCCYGEMTKQSARSPRGFPSQAFCGIAHLRSAPLNALSNRTRIPFGRMNRHTHADPANRIYSVGSVHTRNAICEGANNKPIMLMLCRGGASSNGCRTMADNTTPSRNIAVHQKNS